MGRMSDPFDPYLQWLGIREPERPPNHYRLLGVSPFENDPVVLSNAADRQMAHVRTFQTGLHSAESQQLLNELARAKLCLLSPDKKAAYDAELQGAISGVASEFATGESAASELAGDTEATASPGVLLRTPVAASRPKAVVPPTRSPFAVTVMLLLLTLLAILLGLVLLLQSLGALRRNLNEHLGAPSVSVEMGGPVLTEPTPPAIRTA